MTAEWPMLPVLPLLVVLIALPGAGAWRRRRQSRVASALAADLMDFVDRVRREPRCIMPDDSLRARLRSLRVPEVASLDYALDVARHDPGLVEAAARRLALRLRRRVAFERKMLARTAPGLRRGAIAASMPPVAALSLGMAGVEVPPITLYLLLAAEVLGCLLLWQWARVEI